ncbi:MAG: PBP1A family penicillin-binding protein [Gemmatimonadetes bacterium]|nr:PBP1A family penicillin-binding protein [Gemmatimonadota bacterium]MYG84644.1 PBP1A family penicillin-binding protein [Gemmatimonadota bacterium]MYJ90840.1 PBP1A family penicillin-binding protein [Gemmatimonadota bacterium]
MDFLRDLRDRLPVSNWMNRLRRFLQPILQRILRSFPPIRARGAGDGGRHSAGDHGFAAPGNADRRSPEEERARASAASVRETPITRSFRYIRRMVYAGSAALLFGALVAVVLFYLTVPSIPRLPDDLNDIFGQMTRIYAEDQEGNPRLVHTLGGHRRVALEEIAPVFRDAIIATEDADFFHHRGVDKPGIVRAFVTNLREGQILGQGASTITQQLARHLFFTREKVWIRKIREAMAAMQIEARFTKDEILSAYCNNMYFGADAYGVEEAAQRFFSKRASELTLGESALLAGLVQRPSDYNPYYRMDRALSRRETVFRRMMDNGYITEEDAALAREEEITLKGTSIGPARGPYYLDYVEDLLIRRFGSNLVYNGGLTVHIAMDLDLQELAEETIRTRMTYVDSLVGDTAYETATAEERKQALEAALVAVDTRTGAVRALAGGRDYTASEFNRAVESNRQPGSGFKPVVYLAALDHLGYSANTVVVDEPVAYTTELGDLWEPQNFTREYEGPVILKRAFMRSINVVSAKLVSEVGPSTVIEYARRLGITSPLEPILSLALGTNGVSPLEMASAYSVFATGGIYHRPYVIIRVEDSEGRMIEETVPESRRVISEQSAYLMLDLLRGVISGGTGVGARYRYGFTAPSGGKTGTSSESRDVWFNGFTKDLATSVWVGYDDARPLLSIVEDEEITGASGAIPVWAPFMKQAAALQEQREVQAMMAAADSARGPSAGFPADRTGDSVGPEAGVGTTVDEEAKPPPAFPMPLGIEKIRVDFRTGRPSQDQERSLVVTVRGTNPRVRTEMIPSDGAATEETGLLEPGGPADGAAAEETSLLEPGGPVDR